MKAQQLKFIERKMRIIYEHLPFTLLVGIAGWLLTADPICFLAALLGGWLIDFDHLVDFLYYACRTGSKPGLRLLMSGSYFKLNGKVLVPLHSWEIVLVIGYVSFTEQSYAWACAGLAMGLHLLQDQFSYKVRPGGYVFILRAIRYFDINNFCRVKAQNDRKI